MTGSNTSGDAGINAFAQSVELALAQAYAELASSGKVATTEAVEATNAFAAHHQEHAAALGALAGSRATSTPNRRLASMFAARVRDAPGERAALRVALTLENEASSTYLFALGSLEATDALQLAASILPVESRHAVVLAAFVNETPRQTFPAFETQDEARQPDEFPAPS
ncbi:MAG TPA: ferritin-like domain-containing protein [Acidimicrobiia bacterium]|nr:ferritin-like domain-containing protein [Acidimicrobiia bacterium]